jgi:hypothetical protein
MAQITPGHSGEEARSGVVEPTDAPPQLHSLRQDLPRFNKSRVFHLGAYEAGETTFEFEITARIKPQCVIMDWDDYCPVIPHDVFEGTPSNPILL